MKKKAILLLLSALLLTACAETKPQTSEGESSAEASSEVSEEVKQRNTVTIGEGVTYEVTGVNVPSEADGVYIYDRFAGDAYTETEIGTDFAVCNGAVVMQGQNLIIPESGYVVRVTCEMPAVEIPLGARVQYTGETPVYLPERYVRFGDTVIEVGYKNTTRTVEVTGFLFDDGWYADSTCSNIWGLEIAVDASGKVVTVNPSGTESSGNTPIPAGGYVLTVGASTTLERRLRSVKVGDTAEYVEHATVYSAKRYAVGGTNEPATDAIAVFDASYGAATPAGAGLTEVVVERDGRVSAVYARSAGGTPIPDDGYVLVASGTAAASPASVAKVGTIVAMEARAFWLIENPKSVAERLALELVALGEVYQTSVSSLAHIDFAAADKALRDAAATVAAFGDAPAEEVLLRAAEQLETARLQTIPCLTLQNREAWVTIGELNYDGSFLLHYTDDADVDRAVSYAKRVGLNTLIIDNCIVGYAAYPSKVEGMVMLPELNGFDVVGSFSRACKEQGLKLIVMVNGFSSGVSSVQYPENHYLSLYGDCVMVSKNGNTVDASGVITLEPSESAVREFNLAVAKELAETYEIAGMQVDYIRYPLPIYYQAHNYEDFGYESPVAEAFEAEYGYDPKTLSITAPLWADWCRYRRDVISGYAKAFYEAVKSVDESLEVSFTCFADYNDRQIYVYQDVEKWVNEGYADAIYPMIYGADTAYQHGYVEQIAGVTEHAGLIPGVGFYVGASRQSIIEQLYMPYEFLAEGAACFTLRYISYCGYDEAVRDAFRLSATPKGLGETTEQAVIGFLSARVQQLSYLFDDAGLTALQDGLETADVQSLQALFDGAEIGDETLKAALLKDLAYALRFVS